jgi:hypothetical protein
MHFWTFLCVWAAFSGVTGYFLYLGMSKKADHTTPRKASPPARPGRQCPPCAPPPPPDGLHQS